MAGKIIEEPTYRERVFVFQDRLQAGSILAEKLREYTGQENVILLALPAGGVPVSDVIAKKLNIPMDLLVVTR